MLYYIIWTDYNGLRTIVLSKEDFLKELKGDRYGWRKTIWCQANEFDPEAIMNGMIIKGSVVFPKPKEVVTAYDIE